MAKIRPIEAYDIRDTYGAVQTTLSMSNTIDSSTVESISIFGDRDADDSLYENLSVYHRTGYIKLALPVLNFFLAGEKAKVLHCLLPDYDVEAIARGQRYYDLYEGKEYAAENMQIDKIYGENILLGGNYIKWLIEKLDVQKEICKELKLYAYKALKPQLRKLDKEEKNALFASMQVHYGGNGTKLTSGYSFVIDYVFDENKFRAAFDALLVDELNNLTCRLTYLFSIRKNKDTLTNMVMEYLIVLPIGYRDKFKNMRNPLTKAYNAVVAANIDLQNLLLRHSVKVSNIRESYQELVRQVTNLTIKSTYPNETQKYKTLFDLLKGKEGLIRDKMQGARIDYSGRSVIVVDPNMPLDTIGIPESIAESIMEHEELKMYHTQAMNKSELLSSEKRVLRKILAKKALEKIYIVLGRQPTLYNLGIRGFKVIIVKGDAIVISPLITLAFNADFDGDQMWCSVPLGSKAKMEVEKLFGVKSNLFLSRNGELHIAPRMEILHGLWKATNVEKTGIERELVEVQDDSSAGLYDEVFKGVLCNTLNIYDYASIDGNVETIGRIAVRACFPQKWRRVRLGVVPITMDRSIAEKAVSEKFFKELGKIVAMENKDRFVTMTNKFVQLGLAVANIFPPSIPIVEFPEVEDLIEKFKQRVGEHEKYYNIGLETAEAYSVFYDSAYNELEKDITKRLERSIRKDNGYMEIVKSGARGKMSNIMQIFGMKGRVMKNELEPFNAIIEKPFAKQLSGLESFITAYGGRQGLIDKSIQTYQPGYLSRKMGHTTSPMYITCEDCGTTDGVLIDYDFVKQFVSLNLLTGIDAADNKAVMDYFSDIAIGRFTVEGGDKLIKDKDDADLLYRQYIADTKDDKLRIKSGLKMRSPITCNNPCCVKCYGVDMGTNRVAIVGYPAGFTAATSIGEPGTQLTMKNFQNGGIAGVKNLTSSFNMIDKYIGITQSKREKDSAIQYDFIAPVEGYLETVSMGNNTKRLFIYQIDDKGKRKNVLKQVVLLYEGIEVKDYVKVGDSIQKLQGDLDIYELMRYRSVEYAQKYLAVKLFNIFRGEVFVSLKHFEILVASMTFFICTEENDYFKLGCFYTVHEYYQHDRTGAKFVKTLKGVARVPLYRNDVFSTIFMENIKEGIGRSIVLSGSDSMTLPITRYAFGLDINMGSAIDGYLDRRGQE